MTGVMIVLHDSWGSGSLTIELHEIMTGVTVWHRKKMAAWRNGIMRKWQRDEMAVATSGTFESKERSDLGWMAGRPKWSGLLSLLTVTEYWVARHLFRQMFSISSLALRNPRTILFSHILRLSIYEQRRSQVYFVNCISGTETLMT